jgi:hypothetical protein
MQPGSGDSARKQASSRAATAVALALALIAGLASAPVLATDAAELIKEGVALRRQGNDTEALKKFQQAFETDKSPRVLAQIGLAEQALGRWISAHEHLNEALAAKSDGWIAKNRATINDALSVVGDHVGRIEILGGAPGAEVRIDGVPRGTLPLRGPLTLTTGTVTIDLSAPGFVPVQRTAVVRARQTSRESFDPLAPVSERPSGGAAAGRGGGGPTATVTSVTKREVAALPSSEPTTGAGGVARGDDTTPANGPDTSDSGGGGASPLRGSAKWVAWGLGVASAGLGVFGYVQQNKAADDFGKGCGVDPMGNIQPLPTSMTSIQRCHDLKGDVDSNFRLEIIGFVGAAVFVGAGFALWLTEPSASDGGTAAVACFPGLTAGNGVAMGCSFRL